MFGGEVLPLQQLQQPALKRGGAGHANCGRPGDERYDYDYEVVNCTEPSKVEALVTAAGLEWSDVDELSEEDVSTTRAASRGPCVAQSHQGVRGRRESGLGHAAATCYRGGVPGRAAYGCVPVEAFVRGATARAVEHETFVYSLGALWDQGPVACSRSRLCVGSRALGVPPRRREGAGSRCIGLLRRRARSEAGDMNVAATPSQQRHQHKVVNTSPSQREGHHERKHSLLQLRACSLQGEHALSTVPASLLPSLSCARSLAHSLLPSLSCARSLAHSLVRALSRRRACRPSARVRGSFPRHKVSNNPLRAGNCP
jgi:hypothetical protein